MGKNELEQALQQTISLITEQKKEYNRLDKEQTSVSDILDKASRRKDLLAFKEQYDIYNSQLAERYTAYKQYEEEYSKLPSVEKLSIQFSNLDELNKISIQLKHIELSSSEKERLDSLEEKLSNVTDKEIDYYMKAYNKMSSLYQDIKDTRAHLTANYEAVYDKPEKSSPAITIAAAIIGIILIAAGIIIPSLAVITFLLGIVCIMGGIAYGLVNKDRYKNNMRTYNIRNEQYDIIKERLENNNININNIDNAKIVPYIYNMEEIMNISNIIVARSGAMTITEISNLGKPSILIPLPNVSQDHQLYNAKVLENVGAAKIILNNELKKENLEEEIEKIIKTPKLMQDMEEKALSKSVKNVQEKIYKEIEKLVR